MIREKTEIHCPRTLTEPKGVAAGRRAGPVRVVVALSTWERERFFGRGRILPGDLPLDVVDVCLSVDATHEWESVLRAIAPEILVSGWSTPPLPEAWLERPESSLRYVCHVTGSVRQKVPRSFLLAGGRVSNWGDLVARPVAEHALLLALAALRELPAWRGHLARPVAGRGATMLSTRSLTGKRVGVHGFGAVARELISLLQPFRPVIGVHAMGVPEALIRESRAVPHAHLVELCGGSDVFFECEALTPATRGSMTAAAIRALPRGAVFVNVGRGRVVDEEALLEAATERCIRVALDVVTEDPMPPHSPWLRVEGALVSPHIGGPTRDEDAQVGERVVRNVRRYLAGDDLEGEVTLEIFDRST